MNEELAAGKELKPQGDLVFALDIGTRTVVGMLGRYVDEKFCLDDYISVPHTKRAMVDGQVEDIKQVAKIVSQVKAALEERNGIKLSRVSIAAAGRALRTVQVSMEFDTSDKEYLTEDIVKSMEVETIQKAQTELDAANNGKTVFYCVGHSIITYKLDDYKILSLVGHKGDKAEIELVAAFLPSIVIEGLYAVMDLNGLEVHSLTLEPIAAMNVIVPPEIRLINIALVDIGAGTSDIAIAKNGAVCAYAMATTAGDEITEEIIKTCLVDFATAERLKQSCSSGDDVLEYKDILGIPHKVQSSDIAKMLSPAVDTLADTVCGQITAANGASPAAVFLVGGGSLIDGLAPLIAQKLGLDESRVAIGGGDFLKNVDENASKLGAEYVTPLGIAVTAMFDQGYDFSVITVNDRKVRVFDTKQLSVYEALTMAGYKSAEIMGRSGRNLSFTLNGTRRMIKGGAMTPAEVFVNEKPSSIMNKVTQGDRIRIIPAVSGDNASAKLSDVLTYGRFNKGSVTFSGEKYEIGLKAWVNGEAKDSDYQIQPLDSVESSGIVTLGDLITFLGIEFSGVEYRIGDKTVDESYELCDGDAVHAYDSYGNIIGEVVEETPAEEAHEENEDSVSEDPAEFAYTLEQMEAMNDTASEETVIEEYAEIVKSLDFEEAAPAEESTESEASASANAIPFNRSGLSVYLNGSVVELPYRDGGYMLLDLIEKVNIDVSTPNSEIFLEVNGVPAAFTTELADGDRTIIRVQERKFAR